MKNIMKHIAFPLFILVVLQFFSIGLEAQRMEKSVPSLRISGVIIQDAYTRNRLIDAKVQIFIADSTTLLTEDVHYSKIDNLGKISYSDGSASFAGSTRIRVS